MRRRQIIPFVSAAIFLLHIGQLDAEDQDQIPELVSDRPDATESSKVVPVELVQFELGWAYARSTQDGTALNTQQFPATLVRVGIHNRVELRAGWIGGLWQSSSNTTPDRTTSGVGDLELGSKVYLREEDSLIPEAALVMGLSLPTGTEKFTSSRIDPGFLLAFSNSLSDSLSLGYNVGIFWVSGEGIDGDKSRHSFIRYSASLGTGLSSRMGAFAEVFGNTALSFDGRPANYFDGGLTFLASPNIQLDASAGIGVSSEAADWFLGLGLVARLPR